MLRIFVFDEPYTVKLRLEGRLTAETVPLLTQHWAEVRSRLKGRKAILDLGDVVEVDEPAGGRWHGFLAQGHAGYAHPNVRPSVEDLACDEPGSRSSQLDFGNDCTWLNVMSAGIRASASCAAGSARCCLLLGDHADVARARGHVIQAQRGGPSPAFSCNPENENK